VAINIVAVSGKKCSSLGKIVVCPEKFFDSLTENCFGERGGGRVEVRRKKILSRGPKVAEKGPRHKICLRNPCSSVTLLNEVINRYVVPWEKLAYISLYSFPGKGTNCESSV
jgi:hypothetical protein